MNYNEFSEALKNIIQTILGADYYVRLLRGDKANGLSLNGIIILKRGREYAPKIYLEAYYEEFQKGKTLEEVAGDIITFYHASEKILDPSFLSVASFETVKDRLFYKLVNYEKNQSLLSNVPHVKFMDLAVIFCILIKRNDHGIGSITVKKELLEHWRISMDLVYAQALENTPLLFEFRARTMEDVIQGILMNRAFESDGSVYRELTLERLRSNTGSHQKFPMYVAGNSIGINGASYLLQEDELYRLSQILCCNLYILPSSIHELIILPATAGIAKEDLLRMVREVNETRVAPEEVLSDNVYFYNSREKTLSPLF